MFDHDGFSDHESVTWLHDAETGLRAIIAVHSLHLEQRQWPAACGAAPTGGASRGRGVVYVPDCLARACGLSAVGAEYMGQGSEASVLADVDAVGPRVRDLLGRSRADAVAPERIADRMAREILAAARATRAV